MKRITKLIQLQILLFTLLFSYTINAQVGIGNTDPATTLDINGSISIRDGGNIALSAGNNDITLPLIGGQAYSNYRITGPLSDFNIDRIVPVTNSDGQIVVLQNTTAHNMTIRHNIGGTDVNSVYVPGGQNLTLQGQYSTVTLMYSDALSRWSIVSHNDNLYGNNITSNAPTNDTFIYSYIDTAPFVTMNGMTVTFTPKHSVVYVNFSAAGFISPTINGTALSTNQCGVYFRLQKIEAGTTTTHAHTTTVGTDYDFDDVFGDGVLTGWNGHFTMYPIPVTPGVSTTIRVQWRSDTFLGNTSTGANPTINPIVFCNPSSDTFSHRSLTIVD